MRTAGLVTKRHCMPCQGVRQAREHGAERGPCRERRTDCLPPKRIGSSGVSSLAGAMCKWRAERKEGCQRPTERMTGERQYNRKEPRPPIRVEALPPRWAQVTWLASLVSVGRPAPPWAVSSALPAAQPGHPTGAVVRRNEALQTKLGYPSQSIPSATAIPPIGRCGSGAKPRVSRHLQPVYQLASTCASSCGTPFLLYLRALSSRTIGFATLPIHGPIHGQALQDRTKVEKGPAARTPGKPLQLRGSRCCETRKDKDSGQVRLQL
jgi:hypothetical protein